MCTLLRVKLDTAEHSVTQSPSNAHEAVGRQEEHCEAGKECGAGGVTPCLSWHHPLQSPGAA